MGEIFRPNSTLPCYLIGSSYHKTCIIQRKPNKTIRPRGFEVQLTSEHRLYMRCFIRAPAYFYRLLSSFSDGRFVVVGTIPRWLSNRHPYHRSHESCVSSLRVSV